MKKLLIIFLCFVLAIGACVMIHLNIDPVEARNLEGRVWVDIHLNEMKRTPHQYLQSEYGKYVVHNISFEQIDYKVSDAKFTCTPISYDNPGIYWISHCKAFDSESRLYDETSCKNYMKQLWHGLGEIGYGDFVPSGIVHFTEQNVVKFYFYDYSLHHNQEGYAVMDGGMSFYVDGQNGELLDVGLI